MLLNKITKPTKMFYCRSLQCHRQYHNNGTSVSSSNILNMSSYVASMNNNVITNASINNVVNVLVL